jgi:predicted DNA binding CopG/RHH family protein
MSVPKPKKTLRPIPKFDSEEQERELWAKRDSTAYIDWRQAKRVKLSKLRPTTRTISIRLPETMIERLKVLANKRDVPYQSLLKMFVADRIEEELRSTRQVGQHS